MFKKCPVFQAAFEGWDVEPVARYDGHDIERIMATEGMVRNAVKITCVITNPSRMLAVKAEYGSFAKYLWQFTGDAATSSEAKSRAIAGILSADLKRRGFKFAGPATAFGLMQDVGLVNDHDPLCFKAYHLARA